jgi:hypothetical protein
MEITIEHLTTPEAVYYTFVYSLILACILLAIYLVLAYIVYPVVHFTVVGYVNILATVRVLGALINAHFRTCYRLLVYHIRSMDRLRRLRESRATSLWIVLDKCEKFTNRGHL